MLVSAKAKQTQGAAKEPDSDHFEANVLSQALEIENLGQFLQGVRHKEIMEGQHVTPYRAPCCGLLKDLLNLRRKDGKSYKDLCQWWLQLTGDIVTDTKMTKAAAKFQKKNAKLQPCAHRPNGSEVYKAFLSSSPFEASATSSSTSSSNATSGSAANDAPNAGLVLKLAEGAKQLAAVRRIEEEQSKEISELKFKVTSLIEVGKDYFSQFHTMKEENNKLERVAKQMKSAVQDLKKEVAEKDGTIVHLRQRLKSFQKQSVEGKLRRREKKVQALKDELPVTAHLAEQRQTYYKAELRELQLKHADVRRQLDRAKDKLKKQDVAQREALLLAEHAEADIPVVRLKNDQGHFKTEAKVCIMALAGECEVPAHRCGTVIQTVVERVCGARVPDDDLPSQRSALLTVH